MRNLIERLRDGRGDGHAGGCQGCYQMHMEDAADEIERLRAALKSLVDLRWVSIEKDNMKFQARTTCFTLEAAKKALSEQKGD